MLKRQGAVMLAACALLACGPLVRAADPVATGSPSGISPAKPLYLEDAPASTSLINDGLGKTGMGKMMTDYGIKVGAFIEGSYTYNFDAPQNNISEGRVFDFEHNAARLNQIDLNISRAPDVAAAAKAGKWDFGFMLEAIYGSDAGLIHPHGSIPQYNHGPRSPINQLDLVQAYGDLIIPVGNGLDIKFGKFVTYFGAETINPTLNTLFSHSYNFGFGIPFTQTGIVGTYAFDDHLSAYGGISRGWDQNTKDNNGAVDALFGATFTRSDELKFVFNGSVGPQQFHNSSDYRYLLEALAYYTPKNSQWSFTVDGLFGWEEHASPTGNTARWYGVTAYAGYKLNSMCTVNLRGEWFRDEGGTRIGLDGNFYEATLGVTVKPFPSDKILSNLVIRPEVRYDYSNKSAFDSGARHDQCTAAVDAIFSL